MKKQPSRIDAEIKSLRTRIKKWRQYKLPSCHIVEEEVVVPAHTERRRRIECDEAARATGEALAQTESRPV